MKRSFIIAMLVVFVLAIPAIAAAGGWYTSVVPTGNSPHGGYTTATRKCSVCHAVHEAENAANTMNGYLLLRSTDTGACDYCHVSAAGFGATQVYNSLPASYSVDQNKEHSLLSVNTTIPDSGDLVAGVNTGTANPANDYVIVGGLKCQSCHSVHGAKTIAGPNILKAKPWPSSLTTAATETEFCANCHTNNLIRTHDLGYWAGTATTDTASHYMGATSSATVASTASTDCKSCHLGGSIAPTGAANNYPHLTRGLNLLQDNYDASGTQQLDSVCIACHPNVGANTTGGF